MRRIFLFLFLTVTVFAVNGQTEKLKFSEYDLPNGLHVILYQDHTTPNVLVSVMYHVGAKNENPERTGFAHLFEHLMFEGSENIGRGEYFAMVQAAGGAVNANTTQDRTYYFENVPSNELQLALWMESERMLHAKIDSVGVATQKGVVIEERKQTYDNRPYGTFMEELGKRTFKVHPYKWQTIGNPEHIINATFDDINNFYKTYYVPNNAVLVIAGDFDEDQAKGWVKKYFEDIPKGTLSMYRPDVVEPQQTEEVRDTVYDKIQLPAVFMAYHAPAMGSRDYYVMEVLSQILYGGESSRIKTNIDDKGLSAQSLLFCNTTEDPGVVYVVGISNVGKDIKEVEEAISNEIQKITTELVSPEEFQMAMAAKEFETAASLQSLAGIAQRLADNYTYFKDADRINRELSYYDGITREELLSVAKKYFQPDSRVVLYYLLKE
ncbi:MAG: insulinase family protein [Dysgonamonadaceae bacterium]|jgi:predicted Zn-dependent peptidase|nr:insulinase family protein [Dysgonamonadaceae bacterium]